MRLSLPSLKLDVSEENSINQNHEHCTWHSVYQNVARALAIKLKCWNKFKGFFFSFLKQQENAWLLYKGYNTILFPKVLEQTEQLRQWRWYKPHLVTKPKQCRKIQSMGAGLLNWRYHQNSNTWRFQNSILAIWW